MTLTPDRVAALDGIHLDRGSHSTFDEGHCAMEVVSWLAGLGFTDAPSCSSPVIATYTIALNDRWPAEKRQLLKPYLPRMVGTGSDGLDPQRRQVATQFLATRLLEPWLRLAGMDDEVTTLTGLDEADIEEVRSRLWAIRRAAWDRREASMRELRAKVKAELLKRNQPAAAAADAADAADAVVAADAAAAAVAAVVAADAAADAAAAAVAAVVAADAVADAVADVAVVAADAVADAVAAEQKPLARYSAAYAAARAYYRENPPPVMAKINAIAAEQEPLALELLDLLIDPARAVS